MHDIYTLKQIADSLSLSKRTVEKWRKIGLIPLGEMFDGRLFYTALQVAEIRNWHQQLKRLQRGIVSPDVPRKGRGRPKNTQENKETT